MKIRYHILGICMLGFCSALTAQTTDEAAAADTIAVIETPVLKPGKTATIQTSAGTMKVLLYDEVPNHQQAFIKRARNGEYDGTLFTRVIPEFMIQGGAPDSRTAPAGARCGFGDRSSEIMPEMKPGLFHKRGILAAPRQNDDVNPQKKSDMSQFFIVQGKVYTTGELDTLETITNQKIRLKAVEQFFEPVKTELALQKASNKREYQKRLRAIHAQIDSTIRATPGHLIFTDEQRKAYTTEGGCHHLDNNYTIYGELIDGFDVLDAIATQPKDAYDRPKKDIRIIKVTIDN